VLSGAEPTSENRTGLLKALDARCRLLNQLGRFSDAEADARRLAELAQTSGDQRFRGRGLREAGVARYNLGDYAGAIAAYESSIDVLEQTADPDEVCRTRSEIGWIHSSQGDYEAAESHFLAALETPGLSDGSQLGPNA
jgi:tetratricopeptide (TPR) repeat protein